MQVTFDISLEVYLELVNAKPPQFAYVEDYFRFILGKEAWTVGYAREISVQGKSSDSEKQG